MAGAARGGRSAGTDGRRRRRRRRRQQAGQPSLVCGGCRCADGGIGRVAAAHDKPKRIVGAGRVSGSCESTVVPKEDGTGGVAAEGTQGLWGCCRTSRRTRLWTRVVRKRHERGTEKRLQCRAVQSSTEQHRAEEPRSGAELGMICSHHQLLRKSYPWRKIPITEKEKSDVPKREVPSELGEKHRPTQ